MKRLVQFALPALLIMGLAACGSKREELAETPAAAEAVAPSSSMAYLDGIPVSTADLGAFPFFNLPDGFARSNAAERTLEQKYVFPGGGLLIIEGRYHHARILVAEGSEWNETFLLRSIDGHIKALGGVQVFDGGLPDAARAKIAADSPRFASDLYDPSPYRFRQYVIRTPEGRVWIEIGYGYNAEMADLTIVQEGLLRQTITQVTADAIDRQLKDDGKAVLDIRFDHDRATLLPEGRAATAQIADLLKAQPALKLSIEGHTDDSGTSARNTALSLERALAVQVALVQAGVEPQRLKVLGFGATRPLAQGATDADRAKNRRVELLQF